MSKADLIPQSTIKELADAVYENCLQAPSGYLFSVQELHDLTPGRYNMEVIQRIINELLGKRQIQALTQAGQPVFKAISRETLEK